VEVTGFREAYNFLHLWNVKDQVGSQRNFI